MDIKIGDKIYKIEFSFESAKYDDCVTKLYKLVADSADDKMQNNGTRVLMAIAGQPSTVITLFHAGLLENNATGSVKESENLLKQYFQENKGSKDANFYGVYKLLNKQMEDDGFFDLIGLTGVIEEMTEASKKLPKQLQDHKKKSTSQK